MLHSTLRAFPSGSASQLTPPPPHFQRNAVEEIFYQLTDPVAMASMVLGGGVFRGAHLGLRSLSQGIGTRLLAPLVAMALEAPAMVLSSRGLHRIFEKNNREALPIGEEIVATALTIGPLRAFGAGGSWLARRTGYSSGAMTQLLTHGGSFAGILAGQWAERHYLHLPALDISSALTEGAKIFTQFHLGAHLLPQPLEKFFQVGERRLFLRDQASSHFPEIPIDSLAFHGAATASGPAPRSWGSSPTPRWQEMQNVARSGDPGSPVGTQPKVAIIGGGMAGMVAARTLRKAASPAFHPQLTLLEGASVLGGKVAPRNMGAQFLDEEGFESIMEMVQEHGLPTRWRGDYDAAIFELARRKGPAKLMSEDQFLRALQRLRETAIHQLQSLPAKELDQRGVVDLIKQMHRHHRFDTDQREAMLGRLALEEGTFNISLLSFAVNLAKSKSPMRRLDVVGGLHRVIEAEAQALQNWGAQVLTQTPVKKINVLQEGVEVFFRQEKKMQRTLFDAAILAVSPEHLGAITVTGSQIPFARISDLELPQITKTNVVIRGQPPGEEIANNRFAKWFSPHEDPQFSIVTFFHGWQNRRRLTKKQIIREALGLEGPARLISVETKIWGGRRKVDGIAQGYTTMPAPGQGQWVFDLIEDLYIRGRYDRERLTAANHLLGAGCYVRDAANSGEMAALTTLRQLGVGAGPDPAKFYPRIFVVHPVALRQTLLEVLRRHADQHTI